MLDVHRLRVLRSVVETGSVTRAAAALNYTPSAVSQHLSALEREAGMPLMERSGRGIRPTQAGVLLAEHAVAVMQRLAQAEEALAGLRSGRSGRIAFSAFPSASTGLVPAAVEQFRRACPDVRLDFSVAEAEPALEAVRQGETDLAIVLQPPLPAGADEGLVREHLLDDPFRVVLPKAHPLAARRSIDLRDLAEEGWVGATACVDYCDLQAVSACTEAGFTQRVVVEADDYPAVLTYVSLGVGVALVPLLALGATRPGTVVRRVKGREPLRQISAVTRPALLQAGPVPALLESLRTAAGSEAAAESLRLGRVRPAGRREAGPRAKLPSEPSPQAPARVAAASG